VSKVHEGTWFAVPLGYGSYRTSYAVGIVARAAKRGDGLFGYLLGPLRTELPPADELTHLRPADSILVTRFRDQALVAGNWSILAESEDFRREDWPMPEFLQVYIENKPGMATVIRYSENDLYRFAAVREIPAAEAHEYTPDHGELPPSHVREFLRRHFGLPTAPSIFSTEPVERGVRYVLAVPPESVDEARGELSAHGFTDPEILHDEVGRGDPVWIAVWIHGDVRKLRSSVDETRAQLTAIAEKVGGQFDGLDWALR
jgi:hypothetical protein